MASAGWRNETGLPSTRASPPLGRSRAGEDVEQLVLALALERHDAQHLARVELERRRPGAWCPRPGRAPRSAASRPRRARGGRPRSAGAPAWRSTTSPSISSTIRSSEPAVTSTTPTVSPSRSTVARSQTAAISIMRWEMKMTRAVAAALAADDLEHALGEVRRQRRGHLVEHQHVGLDRQRAGEVDDPERGQRQAPRRARQVEAAEAELVDPVAERLDAASRSAAGCRGCPGRG